MTLNKYSDKWKLLDSKLGKVLEVELTRSVGRLECLRGCVMSCVQKPESRRERVMVQLRADEFALEVETIQMRKREYPGRSE